MGINLIKNSNGEIDFRGSMQLVNSTIGLSGADLMQLSTRAKSGGKPRIYKTNANREVVSVSGSYNMAFRTWQTEAGGMTQANLDNGDLIITLAKDDDNEVIYGEETFVEHPNTEISNFISKLPQGEPWFNLYSPNSPVEWWLDDTNTSLDDGVRWGHPILPRLKRHQGATLTMPNNTQIRNNLACTAWLPHWDGYDHTAERLEAEVYVYSGIDNLILLSYNIPEISDIDWSDVVGSDYPSVLKWGVAIKSSNISQPTGQDEAFDRIVGGDWVIADGLDDMLYIVDEGARHGEIRFYNNISGWQYVEYRVAIFNPSLGVVATFPTTQTKVRYYNNIVSSDDIEITARINTGSGFTDLSINDIYINAASFGFKIPTTGLTSGTYVSSITYTFATGLPMIATGASINVLPGTDDINFTKSLSGITWTNLTNVRVSFTKS